MSNVKELRELIIKANKTELKYITKLSKEDLVGKGFEHSLQSISKADWREEPTTLIIVLRALRKIEAGYDGLNESIFEFVDVDYYENNTRSLCPWDLTKDLDGQSEETISKLLKLIKE